MWPGRSGGPRERKRVENKKTKEKKLIRSSTSLLLLLSSSAPHPFGGSRGADTGARGPRERESSNAEGEGEYGRVKHFLSLPLSFFSLCRAFASTSEEEQDKGFLCVKRPSRLPLPLKEQLRIPDRWQNPQLVVPNPHRKSAGAEAEVSKG